MSQEIKIKSVENIKNLFSFGNSPQNFQLKKGISFISGYNTMNERRNFTGKTSLLNIFSWVLFNKVEKMNKSNIVNWKNKKKAEATIKFSKGSNEYIVHRGLSPDFLKICENGTWLPVPANKTDFQNQLETDILEMNLATYLNTNYGSPKAKSILEVGKPEKRKFLDQIFNMEYYTKIKNRANKKFSTANIKIDNINIRIEGENTSIKSLLEQTEKLEKELNDIPDNRENLKENKEKLDKFLSLYEDTLKKLEKFEKEKSSLYEEKTKINEIILKITYKIKELEKYLKVEAPEEEKITPLKEKKKDLQKELKELKPKPLLIGDEPKETFIESSKKHMEEMIKHDQLKDMAEAEIRKIDDRSFDDDMVECPTCFSKVDPGKINDHLHKLLVGLQNKFEFEFELAKQHKECLDRSNKSIENIEKIEKENEEIEIRKNQIQDEIETMDDKIQKIYDYKEALKKQKKYSKVIEKLKKVKENYSSKNIDEKLNEINDKIKKINVFIQKVDDLKKDVEWLEKNVEHEKSERKRYKDWIKTNKKKVDKHKENIVQYEDEKTKLNTLKDYAKCVVTLSGDDYVKQYTISNKVPILNKMVNDYLSETDVNFYVKLDNWLECEFRGPGIKSKDCSYNNLSGAERISIDRALQFSFNDIVKQQSPTFLNLLILDEILDSSVDTIGLKDFMKIIKRKQQKDDSSVLIVSHREGFDELDKFIDHRYCVEYDGNYSKILEV